MTRRPRVPAAVTALVAAGLVAGCTVAPSGRLDTAPQDGPTVQPTPRAAVTPLPTFDASTAVGDYAAGFPSDLVRAPDDAEIIASSAEPVDGGLVRLSLNLATPRTADEILADLGAPLAAAGFAQSAPAAASGLTAQTAWTRRTDRPEGTLVETLLVGVLDDGTRRLVSVSGTVQAPHG
ncbi:hypothetical protein [Xylanimonas protaetiae]|uniref:Lipoprotein n=1 Tax=Xylanimonas protaetiae TaxID=2509457 RepID=A0A4P6F6C3_9MICO|nr:hypothetical protein [Xylanimonas protaetiae]QAY71302.1 hypothetical protein ET471_15745 [Xylanimonas protaetiae]